MAYTQDDLVAIERAIAGCTRSVRFADGREQVFDSMDERMKALSDVKLALAGQSSRPTVRGIRIFTTKGF